MLESIKNIADNVSSLFVFQSEELMKLYPPFVNFFQQMKETIIQCEKMKPRFHAFLKVTETSN